MRSVLFGVLLRLFGAVPASPRQYLQHHAAERHRLRANHIPLGAAPKRLDCSQLYNLEIARLKAEIQALKVGLQ